jgi:predicted nucleic acid-binding protein
MKDNIFLDTNIFIYALTEPKDHREITKRDIAIKLLKELVNKAQIIVSIQVINELHINMVKKFKIDDEIVLRVIRENIATIADIKNLSYQTYKKAFDIRTKYNISYWDSLVIASALENNCSTVYSEDMHHNLLLEDTMQIINPFLP